MKKIRVFAGFMLLLPLLLCLSVQAAEQKITISYTPFPSGVWATIPMDQKDAWFDVDFNYCDTGVYTVEYSIDGWETKETASVEANASRRVNKRVSLSHLPKGVHTLEVRVLKDGEVAAEASKSIAIFEYYTPQFLDDYSRVGVCITYITDNYASGWNSYLTDMLNRTGIKRIRGGSYSGWSTMEPSKGHYSYYRDMKFWGNELEKKLSPSHIATGGMWNGLYNTDARMGRIAINGLANHIRNYLVKWPGDFSILECWNEPELKQFLPLGDDYAIQYSNIVRGQALAAKEVRPDIPVAGGNQSGSSSGPGYMRYMFAQNIYPYLDAITYHPYTDIQDFDAGAHQTVIESYERVVEEQGGWLDAYITEVGWKMGANTLEEISEFVPKLYITDDHYGIEGTYYYQFRHNLGDTQGDYGLRLMSGSGEVDPGCLSLAQACKMLNSAMYVGRIESVDGLIIHMYVRDKKPLMVAWTQGKEPITYDFGASGLYAEDCFGNPLETTEGVTLGKTAVYIQSLTERWLWRGALEQLEKEYGELVGRYSDLSGISNVVEMANSLTSIPQTGAGAKTLLDQHYRLGDTLLREHGNAPMTRELAAALWRLHQSGLRLASLYSCYHTGEVYPSSPADAAAAASMSASIKGSETMATLRFSDKMLFFARKYAAGAQDVAGREFNSVRNGVAGMYDYLGGVMCRWARAVMPLEQPETNLGILTYTTPEVVNGYSGHTSECLFEMDNFRKAALTGEVVVLDETGKQVGKTHPISLASGEYFRETLELPIEHDRSSGEYNYTVLVKENGKTVHEKLMPVDVLAPVDIAIHPSETVLSGIEHLELDLKNNLRDDELDISVSVVPPEGWVVGQEQSVKIAAQDGTQIQFAVTAAKQKPFNEYVFDVQIHEPKTGALLCSKKVALDFLVVVEEKAEINVSAFNSDISGWANAYPVHLNYTGTTQPAIPVNPDLLSAWKETNCAPRLYMKYDADNYYILLDVFDDIHANPYGGNDNWRGDSVQLMFDTLLNRGDGLGPLNDDVPVTLARNAKFKEEVIIQAVDAARGNWYDRIYPVHSFAGPDAADMLKVIRNDGENTTRYLFKLPKKYLEGLSLKAGTKFGFNLAVNDTDIVDRERMIQITSGVADAPLPFLFRAFTLVTYEKGAAVYDGIDYIDVTLRNDWAE